MNGTQLCTLNRQVAQDVCDFVYKAQPNEESVTDYLLHRLQEANKTFRYINTQQYTRRQEATTGADYELELWLVGKTHSIPLLIQAKKMYKNTNYCDAINYPKKTSTQINNLISYATTNKKLPFYMFYAIPNQTTKTLCQGDICTQKKNEECCCLFLSDANEVKKIANNCITSKSKVFKNDLLAISNPFICLFCCPLVCKSNDGIFDYFRHYYKNKAFEDCIVENQKLPEYVRLILKQEKSSEEENSPMQGIIGQYELDKIKNIAVIKIDDINL